MKDCQISTKCSESKTDDFGGMEKLFVGMVGAGEIKKREIKNGLSTVLLGFRGKYGCKANGCALG